MRVLLRRTGNVVSIIGILGPWRFLKMLLYSLVTSPKIWERYMLRSYHGNRLASAVDGLAAFHSDDLVSVVLPANNARTKGVDRLVASLKAQTHKNIELIAVDSGSTDDTVSWLRSQGFNVLEIEPSSFTHAYSRNTGAAAASGKYILFTVDDVVFNDPDWLRIALYLLNRFGADSMSSSQTIDDKADGYARCLDTFLSGHQNNRLSVNVSRNGPIATWVRRRLPLQAQFRSVAIDDTNHLVRRDAFERIRFHAPTVEDLDFALRLTQAKGKTLYTNFLAVLHYHKHDMTTLRKYARRVFIDTEVMKGWQPYLFRWPSRESFLCAGYHSLALVLYAFELLDNEIDALNKSQRKYEASTTADTDYCSAFLQLTQELDSNRSRALKYRNRRSFQEARSLFVDIVGGEPPPDLYRMEAVNNYFLRCFRADITAARRALLSNGWDLIDRDEVKTVVLFLWTNRIMAHLARRSIFRKVELRYPCDDWNIQHWA